MIPAAIGALVGAAATLAFGWWLTRHDDDTPDPVADADAIITAEYERAIVEMTRRNHPSMRRGDR